MPDRHLDPSLNVRPPAETLTAAQKVLTGRSVEMWAFVTACLAEVADDPDAVLARLAPYWPPPRRRGRRPQAEIDAANAKRPTVSDRALDGTDGSSAG